MQATRAPTTVSVFADCSIPAGLRIGPVPGVFKLGKYVSDRKEVGPKKKVSLKHFLETCLSLSDVFRFRHILKYSEVMRVNQVH